MSKKCTNQFNFDVFLNFSWNMTQPVLQSKVSQKRLGQDKTRQRDSVQLPDESVLAANSSFEVVDVGSNLFTDESVEEPMANEMSINSNESVKAAKTLTQQIPALLSYALSHQWRRQQSKDGDEEELKQNVNESHSQIEAEEEEESEYQYYYSKMNHDICLSKDADSSNDNLFIISKDLFDRTESSEFVEEINSYQHLAENTHDLYQNNTKIKRKRKKFKFGHRKKEKSSQNAVDTNDDDHDVVELKQNVDASPSTANDTKSGLSVWTESLNSMIVEAKHKVYSLLATTSLKWDSRANRHLFSLSNDVWVLGHLHSFDSDTMTSKQVIQSIVSDGCCPLIHCSFVCAVAYFHALILCFSSCSGPRHLWKDLDYISKVSE